MRLLCRTVPRTATAPLPVTSTGATAPAIVFARRRLLTAAIVPSATTADGIGQAAAPSAPATSLLSPSAGWPSASPPAWSSVHGVPPASALLGKTLVYGSCPAAVACVGFCASPASSVASAAAVLSSAANSCPHQRCPSVSSRLQLQERQLQDTGGAEEQEPTRNQPTQEQPTQDQGPGQGRALGLSASCGTFLRRPPSQSGLEVGPYPGSAMSKLEGVDNAAEAKAGSEKPALFAPKRVLVLTKFSRLEFEKRRHKDLNEEELIRDLKARGSDYQSLLHHHNIHTKNRDLVVNTLRNAGLETRLVDRFDYTDANVEWADVIFTTGGDGTFLMAASKIRSRDKPVIGINSDPSRSVGYLCLPGHCTEEFPKALHKLLNGQFRWQWRQRIRVSVQGEHAFDPPLELHNQQLQYPEYRFIDCINEEHKPGTPATPTQVDSPAGTTDIPPIPLKPDTPIRVLPIKSLNEVFIGESLSSRVSYYEISIDGSPRTKVKSSGVTICTGTGSTSWSFNISKVTPQCVKRILEIVQAKTGKDVGVNDSTLMDEITTEFNDSLIFDPSHARMAYTIRDPVFFGTAFSSKPRGFAKRIEIRSRMFDACIVIDGSMSFTFNDGAVAVLEILEQDGLKTVAID